MRVISWLLLALVPGLVLFAAGLWATDLASGRILSLTLSRVAEQARVQYTETVSRLRLALTTPANTEAVRAGLSADRCKALLANIAQGSQANTLALTLADAEGRVVCDSEAAVGAARNLSALPAFRAARESARDSNEIVFNGVRLADGAAAPSVSLSLPVLVDGRFSGVLIAELSLQSFEALARRVGGETPIAVGFVAPDGRVYLNHGTKDEFLPPATQLTTILSGARPVVFSAGRDSRPRLYAPATLQANALYILASAPGGPPSGFMEKYGQFLPVAAVLLHLLGFAAIGVALYFTFLRPLLIIQERAQSIGNTSQPAPALGRAAGFEFHQLGATLGSLEQQLRDQRTELANAEQRHAKAMREIHHRIKNNLQVVSSLLSLQATRLKVPAGRPDFDMARQRLSALALLHRHLYDGKDFHSIELRAFCSDLVEHLRELAGYERTAQIRSHINIPAVSVSADQAVLISLVITEAVTNAFRHAFPGNRPGAIDVEITVQEGRARLVIADDGVGLPEGRLGGSGDDLGGLLIAGFVRQLRGTLNVVVANGTRLEIEFPLDSGAT